MFSKSCVYKITNNSNNKIYIGSTTKGIKKRWINHIEKSKTSNSEMYVNIKNNPENFKIEEICFFIG